MSCARLSIKIDDIYCVGCAADIEAIFLNMEGIINASVNFKKDTITVEYEPEIVSDEEVLSAVVKMGFRAEKP